MSGIRCKACDARLSLFDMSVNKSDTLPEPEDLCQMCRAYAYSDDVDHKEYAFEHITERLIDIDIESDNE